jgi:hypothetical protein
MGGSILVLLAVARIELEDVGSSSVDSEEVSLTASVCIANI